MTTIKHRHGCVGSVDYHPEVPFLKQPKIKGSKIIDGVKYYLGEKGRIFIAETFDRMFKTVKTNIKGKEYKGKLIGKNYQVEVI